MTTNKISLTEKIGEEMVDNILEAGLALLLVIGGVSYFSLDNKWSEALSLIADKAGLIAAKSEITLMINTVMNTFPFNFIQTHQTSGLIIGVTLCVIGAVAKILTLKSKEEFIKDLGKILLIPGVIGVLSIIIIQLLTVSSINDLLVRSSIATTQLTLSKMDPGMMIWNMMGLLFMIGIFSLIFGAMLVYIIRALHGKPAFLYITGKFLVFIGWFGLIYYGLMRLLAIKDVAATLYGENILKLFAFAWYIGRTTFVVALCMFALGFTLYKYGVKEIKRKRRMMIHEGRSHMVLQERPATYPPHQTQHQPEHPYHPQHGQQPPYHRL